MSSAARALRPHPRPSRGPPRRRPTHAVWPLRSSPKRTTSLSCLRHPSRARASEEKASKLGLRVSRSQSVCCTLASTCPLVDLAPDAKLFCTTDFSVMLQPRLVMSEIGVSQNLLSPLVGSLTICEGGITAPLIAAPFGPYSLSTLVCLWQKHHCKIFSRLGRRNHQAQKLMCLFRLLMMYELTQPSCRGKKGSDRKSLISRGIWMSGASTRDFHANIHISVLTQNSLTDRFPLLVLKPASARSLF